MIKISSPIIFFKTIVYVRYHKKISTKMLYVETVLFITKYIGHEMSKYEKSLDNPFEPVDCYFTGTKIIK